MGLNTSIHLHIRVANPADAEAIALLINSAFRSAESFFVDGNRIELEEVSDSLGKGTFLLLEEEATLAGCVYVERRGERGYLGLLAVNPSRQQCGFGSLLMTEAETFCSNLDCYFMDIKIVNLRKELPDFYRKRGYVETGVSTFPPDVETKQACYFIDMAKPLKFK
jgi:GNAT superfamily N-acetyltransferase